MDRSVVRRMARLAAAAAAAAAMAGAMRAAAPDAPPVIRLPRDIVYASGKDSPGPVAFSHETHVALADNRCTGCHPAPFRMLRPDRKVVAHDEATAARSCGACHDGKTATGVQDDCGHCHKPAPSPDGGAVAAPARADTPAAKGGGS